MEILSIYYDIIEWFHPEVSAYVLQIRQQELWLTQIWDIIRKFKSFRKNFN